MATTAPRPETGAIPTGIPAGVTAAGAAPTTGSMRVAGSPTGAIRTIGRNPATAPIMLHPGDSMSTGRRVLYVVMLGALTALGPFTVDLYLPAFPLLERDFHTTQAAVQLTLTGTMLGFGLGQLIVGPLSDRFGRRVPLLVATGLHVVASLAAAFAPNLEVLGITRVVMGMGAAGGGVVAMAMVRDLFGGRRLVIMLSRLALVSGVAPVAAPLIGSWLLGHMAWRGIFVVLAAYAVVLVVAAVFLLRETLPKERRMGAGPGSVLARYRDVLSDRVYLGVLVIGGMTFSGLFSYLSASPFLLQQTYQFTPGQYGLAFALNSLGLIAGNQVAARLAARFGPQWVLAFATAGLFVFGSAIIGADMLGLGLWGTLVPLWLFMSTCGFVFPCVQVLALDRHGKAAGTAASLLGASNNAVAAVISPLVGLISAGAGTTPTTMAVVMVGCSAVGVLALWLLVRPRTVAMLTP